MTSLFTHLKAVSSNAPCQVRADGRSAIMSARAAAILLIFASAGASLLYVWWLSSLTLSPDEAHYWDWSRNLDWSYYSKGPLVAWLIRLSCELLGPLSIALTGDLTAAVRFPAIICHAAILGGWYVLAARVFDSPRFGLAVVACACVLPIVRISAVLMTIDPPFLACWSWALVGVYRALETDRTRWWFAAGLLTAFGILAKYTMALFPAAVVGFLLFHRRGEFRKPGIWLLLAGMLLGWLPVLLWNAGHGWVSFRHVFGQVGVEGNAPTGIRWSSLGNFVGGQFGMMFGFWLVAFLVAGWRYRPTRESNPAIQLLWWVSVPVWWLFAAASLVKPGQPNWPAPAYIGGFVLTVACVREQLAGSWRPLTLWSLGISIAVGAVAVIALHAPDAIRPALALVVKPPSEADPFPIRRVDFTARIAGWEQLATEVDTVRARVRTETGCDPVLAGFHWTIPGTLGFYCDGNPTVYSVGVANKTDRNSQYDIWRPNPTDDAQVFRGRSFVIVGDIGLDVTNAFERVETPRRFVYAPGGVPITGWAIWVCHGFRGFDHAPRAAHRPKF